MNILIFGNHTFPDISFTVNPKSGLEISCKNNHVLNYEGRERELRWIDLYHRSNFRHLTKFVKASEQHSDLHNFEREWPKIKEDLLKIANTEGERAFLTDYIYLCEKDWTTEADSDVSIIASLPALIPQVWLNWIHYDSKDARRAERIKEEPFRVDFVMFTENRKLIIEIDGTSHFSEMLDLDEDTGKVKYQPSMKRYTEHLKKDRWLRGQGWEVWRFSDFEVVTAEKGGSFPLLWEMGFLGLFHKGQ
ncbi:MAG TPA: hypothetical protein VI489_03570 [Candidatus Brocadiaceae bacterium]